MKKKILIYAHYYTPDVASTGQILQDLAEELANLFEVTVICTVPSYTGIIQQEYKENHVFCEKINKVQVIRVPVPEFDKSSKVSRIRNLLAYYREAKKVTNGIKAQDYILTISQPPILGGMLGVYGKKKLGSKLVYCIQDFNPEQIEATGYVKYKMLISVIRWLDKRSCRKSDLVITVGRDLVETLKNRFKNEKQIPKYEMINNWIDEKKIFPLSSNNERVVAFRRQYGLTNKFVFMYSGNMGLYYDLDGLFSVIKRFKSVYTPDGREVAFVFVGSGSLLQSLVTYAQDNKMNNVVFIPYQDKDKLIYSLNSADVHWCVNAKGIKGVSCPSKFYGIAGVGKPIIGVLEKDSEIECLIRETGCGLVCEPGNYVEIEQNIKWFITNSNSMKLNEMGMKGYNYLLKFLTKGISVQKYIDAINSL